MKDKKNRWFHHQFLCRQNKYLFQKFCFESKFCTEWQTAVSPHCTAYTHTCMTTVERVCVIVDCLPYDTFRFFYIIIKSSFHSVYFESHTLVLLSLVLQCLFFSSFHAADRLLADFVFRFHRAHLRHFADILLCLFM